MGEGTGGCTRKGGRAAGGGAAARGGSTGGAAALGPCMGPGICGAAVTWLRLEGAAFMPGARVSMPHLPASRGQVLHKLGVHLRVGDGCKAGGGENVSGVQECSAQSIHDQVLRVKGMQVSACGRRFRPQ